MKRPLPLVPLRNLVEDVATWSPAQKANGSFTYIDLSAVNQDGKQITQPQTVRCSEAPSRARQLIRAGDVLVSTVRPNLNTVAWVPPGFDGATASTGFCVLRPRPDRLDDRYLFHWTKHPLFISHLVQRATGASYPAVSDSIVLDSLAPLPPLEEQRRIADILDRADALRARRRAALALLDTLTQSIFLDMFGDHKSILQNWPACRLGDLITFLTSGSRGWAEYYSETGDLFLRIQNVSNDELRFDDVAFVMAPTSAEAQRTRVRPGDVLLSITADLGRTAVVPDTVGRAFINQHLSIIRTEKIVPRFLSAFLVSPNGQTQVNARNRHGVKAGLNFDDIRSFVIPYPPHEMQVEFATLAGRVDRLRANARLSLSEIDSLFQSIQHLAFNGAL